MKGSDILKQKVEIMSMTDEILSPITKASNVLLEDGSNVQQLIDSYVEPEFTPTIENSSSMSKVGQGDNVDFSANVINGVYESCVLKGKTLVNYNAEGNDRNEYVCMPSVEGESVTANGTVEGLVKSAILKGSTKYRDIDTGEILEAFEEGRNLELVSVKMPVLTTTGKNLIGECLNPTERHKKYKPFLKPETRYTLNYKNSNGSATRAGRVYLLNGETNSEITSFGYNHYMRFTTPTNVDDTTLLCIDLWNNELSVLLVEGEEVLNIDLEKILKEPFKSNILSTSEDVTLRGIGDVKDTLDLVTGEYVQRIGEVVLDGSMVYNKYVDVNGFNTCGFYTSVPGGVSNHITDISKLLCDKLKSSPVEKIQPNLSNITDEEGLCVNAGVIKFRIDGNKASTVEELKAYLSENPIKLTIPLSQDVIKTVGLSDNHVYSYNDTTHYDCSSAEGSLIPTLSIEEGVKYQAIIKPSTKYSIVFNRTVASDSLTVDLGGATANVVSTAVGKTIVQITTLPTLSHNYVKFLGVGNVIKDVQVIEGDVADDIEYFEGMIDVENPVVTNCNILDVDSVDYKSNTISTNEAVLRSLPNGVCDTLDLMTGEYVQRIGEREYQSGDESNSQVSTDKVNTQYQLETPITTTIDLKQHPYAYKDGYINLSSNGENSLTPTIEYSLPINRSGQVTINTQLVQKQQKQLDELESMIIANMVNTQYKQTLSNVEHMLGGE